MYLVQVAYRFIKFDIGFSILNIYIPNMIAPIVYFEN